MGFFKEKNRQGEVSDGAGLGLDALIHFGRLRAVWSSPGTSVPGPGVI